MVKNFNEFNNINEGVIGDFVKKLFKGLVDGIKEDFKKPLEDFTKKVSKTTDPKRMKQIVTDYLESNYDTLNKSLEEANTLSDIHSTICDNLKAIYTSISTVNDTIGNFKFEDIFSDINDKNTIKLFTKGANYFKRSVKSFTSDMLMKIDSSIDKGELKSIEKAEKTNESAINEADETTETEQQELIDDATESQDDTQENNENPQQEDFSDVKSKILKWFNYTIYETVKKKLDFEKSEEDKNKIGGDISNNIQENPLKNKDGITRIVDQISKISDSKQMARLRDILVDMGYDSDYGLF